MLVQNVHEICNIPVLLGANEKRPVGFLIFFKRGVDFIKKSFFFFRQSTFQVDIIGVMVAGKRYDETSISRMSISVSRKIPCGPRILKEPFWTSSRSGVSILGTKVRILMKCGSMAFNTLAVSLA